MSNTKKSNKKVIFWDVDEDKLDLKNPETLKWWLKRKLDFGDLEGIKKGDLKKHLDEIQIDSGLRRLLGNYLKQYA